MSTPSWYENIQVITDTQKGVVPDVGRKNIRPSILFSIFKMLQRN